MTRYEVSEPMERYGKSHPFQIKDTVTGQTWFCHSRENAEKNAERMEDEHFAAADALVRAKKHRRAARTGKRYEVIPFKAAVGTAYEVKDMFVEDPVRHTFGSEERALDYAHLMESTDGELQDNAKLALLGTMVLREMAKRGFYKAPFAVVSAFDAGMCRDGFLAVMREAEELGMVRK